ncbi:glycoside hydrolase family 16 protein [Porticoccus sp. GXU_MW_L64]
MLGKRCFLCAALFFCVGMPLAAETADYQLVWQDEFDCQERLDDSKWGYEQGFVRNQELQWYQRDNAYCENGLLVIEGRREQVVNTHYQKDSKDWRRNRKQANYTSASVNTRGKHAWRYGRFEIRARIRAEAGLWPAIWFLGVEGGWPSNGEVDLMEYYRNTILANVAWGPNNPIRTVWDSTRMPVELLGDSNWDQDFHTWRMDWDKNHIKLYLDDQLLNTTDIRHVKNPPGTVPREPFQQPMYILLNLAIGGQGGDPGKTGFPSRYEIDYVRVYRRK